MNNQKFPEHSNSAAGRPDIFSADLENAAAADLQASLNANVYQSNFNLNAFRNIGHMPIPLMPQTLPHFGGVMDLQTNQQQMSSDQNVSSQLNDAFLRDQQTFLQRSQFSYMADNNNRDSNLMEYSQQQTQQLALAQAQAQLPLPPISPYDLGIFEYDFQNFMLVQLNNYHRNVCNMRQGLNMSRFPSSMGTSFRPLESHVQAGWNGSPRDGGFGMVLDAAGYPTDISATNADVSDTIRGQGALMSGAGGQGGGDSVLVTESFINSNNVGFNGNGNFCGDKGFGFTDECGNGKDGTKMMSAAVGSGDTGLGLGFEIEGGRSGPGASYNGTLPAQRHYPNVPLKPCHPIPEFQDYNAAIKSAEARNYRALVGEGNATSLLEIDRACSGNIQEPLNNMAQEYLNGTQFDAFYGNRFFDYPLAEQQGELETPKPLLAQSQPSQQQPLPPTVKKEQTSKRNKLPSAKMNNSLDQSKQQEDFKLSYAAFPPLPKPRQ